MRRGNAFKQVSAGLVLILGVSLLSACQGKIVDYGNSRTTESTVAERNGAKKGVAQFANAPKWKDTWKAEDAEGNEVTMAVNASISTPDAQEMYVVEVEEIVFDEAYKERIAKELFGNETIYYYDLAHRTRQDLMERDFYQEMYDSDSTQSDLDELLETAKDTNTPVSSYDVNAYLGGRDGVPYTLNFGEGSQGVRFRSFSFRAKQIRQIWPEEQALTDAKVRLEYGEYESYMEAGMKNQCTLSEEEARKLAEDLVDRLGLEYSVCSGSNPLWWKCRTFSDDGSMIVREDQMLDGYMFNFDAGIDEISFVSYGMEYAYENFNRKKEGEGEYYSLQANIVVYVTDEGVIEIKGRAPIAITGVSGAVPLLPLETVQEIMKNQALNEYENLRLEADKYGRISFNQMELIYFRVRDREHEGRYSYIPVWRLSSRQSGSKGGEVNGNLITFGYIDNPILINAIDGSVINFYDEV